MNRPILWALLLTFAACLLRWPGLVSGPQTDDYVQTAMLRGAFPVARDPLALYDFGARTADERTVLREFGWLGWWSAPDLKVAMFRPLTSALLALQLTHFAAHPLLRHTLSVLALFALLASIALVLWELLPVPAARLALLFFALHPALSIPLCWLPNLSALTAPALSAFGLYAYLRWRRAGAAWGAIAGPLAFALATLAGEYGVIGVCYVIAFEGFAARDAARERMRGAAAMLLPVALVIAIGALLGYGVRGSGYYVSPLTDVAAYINACVQRLPRLAAELVWAVPSWWSDIPEPLRGNVGLAAQISAPLLLVAMGAWLVRRADAGLIVLGVGSLLGLPLLAGALPEPRLLVSIAFGFDAVMAVAAMHLVQVGWQSAGRRCWPARILLGVFVAVQLGIMPVRAYASAAGLRQRALSHTRWALGAEVDDTHAHEQQWFVLAAADFTTLAIAPFVRWFHGHPMPKAYRVLSIAPRAHTLLRIDDRTFDLIVLGPLFGDTFAGSLQRPKTSPFAAGDKFTDAGLRVQILSTYRGQPVRMRFTFPKALEDRSYVFLHPGAKRIERIALPAIGEAIEISQPRIPR